MPEPVSMQVCAATPTATPDEQVAQRINCYRALGRAAASRATTVPENDPDYAAWNLAREDYRLISTRGGDPILRDAEHYLFRFWLAREPGAHVIPRGLPVLLPAGVPNPAVVMSQDVMENIHDPIYNTLRPFLERVINIAPTSPSMLRWEKRGYSDGVSLRGTSGTPPRL